jgi:hypothetical protein
VIENRCVTKDNAELYYRPEKIYVGAEICLATIELINMTQQTEISMYHDITQYRNDFRIL